jgi:quinol monooxygenase YgiN
MNNVNVASFIAIKANENKAEDLSGFLKEGSKIVRQTEDKTVLWMALRNKDSFVIFDTFKDENAMEEHFEGRVAALLNENANSLVKNGWDDGVVKNINNSKILSSKTSGDISKAKIATFISLTSLGKKHEDLSNFLSSGAAIIEKTEEKTLHWYALSFLDGSFGIIDFFEDQEGVDAHFNGKVASLLNENAQDLVKGGWEEGVLSNIQIFEVVASNI